MTRRMVASTVVAWFVGFAFGTGDPFTALVFGFIAAILCFVPLFVLSRRRFVKSAAGSVQTLICVLVCMIAVSVVTCTAMAGMIAHLRNEVDYYRNTPAVTPSVNSSQERPQSRAEESGRFLGGDRPETVCMD